MNDQNTSPSASSILLMLGGTSIIILVIIVLVLGGVSGIKERLNPLVNKIKMNVTPPPNQEPIAIPKYTEGEIYGEQDDKKRLDVEEKAQDYGVKLDMPTNEEKIEDISSYPFPTLHPWEPGGRDWQEEYWDNP